MNDWIPSRFAVLRHFLSDSAEAPDHFDLLISDPARAGLERPVQCWRLPVWPLLNLQVAERIGPHRAEWLDEEKAVLSEGRGHISRVCGGDCQVIACSETNWHIRVTGDTSDKSLKDIDGAQAFELFLDRRHPMEAENFPDSWLAVTCYTSHG